MTPSLLCLATAVARAAVFLDAPASATERDLMPAHPAFVGFRRTTYVWADRGSERRVADNVRTWLRFLHDRQVVTVRLVAADAGVEAIATREDQSADRWRAQLDEGRVVMQGRAAAPVAVSATAPGLAARELRLTLDAAAGREAMPTRRAALQRALAILDSPGDGSDLSDVAWPYFVLPETRYDAAARRLLAAAANAWPGSPLAERIDDAAANDTLAEAAQAAVIAAVNSVSQQETAAMPSGKRLQ